jgi:DNA-directed RNA polymerase subunit RPC12/RpoP
MDHVEGVARCASCGATLPEEADCTLCLGDGKSDEPGIPCEACGGRKRVPFEGDTCPDGCLEYDWDAERDRREGF